MRGIFPVEPMLLSQSCGGKMLKCFTIEFGGALGLTLIVSSIFTDSLKFSWSSTIGESNRYQVAD